MGNNTSQIRRSSVSFNEANVRKATAAQYDTRNLDEEFSDKILHEVKKPQTRPVAQSRKFTNDLIEDEFNELNDLIETDELELERNILPNDESSGDSKAPETDDMDVDVNLADTPTPDLATVDFTKIVSSQRTTQETPHFTQNTYNFDILIPVEIKWVNATKETIHKIAIIGSFSNWRNIIRLRPSASHPNEYVVTVKLPLGVHKLLYIINNEYRVSEQLPTATDQEGIFFNWFEVLDERHLFNHAQSQANRTNASTSYDANIIRLAGQAELNKIKKKSNSFLTKISKAEANFEHVEYTDEPDTAAHSPVVDPPAENDPYMSMQDHNSTSFLMSQDPPPPQLQYSSEIPEIFINYNSFKSQNASFELPEPPQLPAHLNNVLLNKLSASHGQTQPHPAHNHPAIHSASSDAFKPPSASYMSAETARRPQLRRADSAYYASNQEAYHLSIPNHVILNHLMTTSIRHDVLTVACITRYSGKFVTQIMHSPAEQA